MTAELLQPDELISGMISQVAAEPEMALLLNHFIYSTAGIRPPHVRPLYWSSCSSAVGMLAVGTMH